ncbi:MAG: TspO/MBR family protein [Bacteroidota bacterium]
MNNLYVKMAIGAVVCLVIGGLSGLATASSIDTWFTTINKPSWNPPNWIFGPMWTTLYILMGCAAGIIWHQGWDKRVVKSALFIFAAQLMLNALWSILFFGMQNPTIAFVEIVVLLILIGLTAKRFHAIKPIAGYLMIPYLLWVAFATFLNFTIMNLN